MKVILLIATFLFSPFNDPVKQEAATILQGVIISADNGLPVTNAYVYVVSGEEEALTNKKANLNLHHGNRCPFHLK